MERFDSKAEANKIEVSTKALFGDYANGRIVEARADAVELAKAYSAYGSDTDKVNNMAKDLQVLGAKTFSSLPNVRINYLDDSKNDKPEISLTPSFWDGQANQNITARLRADDSGVEVQISYDPGPYYATLSPTLWPPNSPISVNLPFGNSDR